MFGGGMSLRHLKPGLYYDLGIGTGLVQYAIQLGLFSTGKLLNTKEIPNR